MGALGVVTLIEGLINVGAPIISGVLTLIRNKDGSLTVVQVLDADDAQFNANLSQAATWELQLKASIAAAAAAKAIPPPVPTVAAH